MLGAIVVIVIFIKLTLSSMSSQKSNVSVFLKILTNHLQLIVLTLNFDLDWPGPVTSVNETAKPLADISSRIISFDCFLGADAPLDRVYLYFLTYLLLPFLIFLSSLLFWYSKYKCKQRSKASSRSTTTIIILLFLFHPSISNNAFNIF